MQKMNTDKMYITSMVKAGEGITGGIVFLRQTPGYVSLNNIYFLGIGV